MVAPRRIALDTDAAIQLANGHWLTALTLVGFKELLLPAPVIGELLFGAHNSGRVEVNLPRERTFVAGFGVLLVDAAAAEQYAEIRFALKKLGRPIPENDMWIAAICRAAAVPLLTTDQHFMHVPGLQRIAA